MPVQYNPGLKTPRIKRPRKRAAPKRNMEPSKVERRLRSMDRDDLADFAETQLIEATRHFSSARSVPALTLDAQAKRAVAYEESRAAAELAQLALREIIARLDQ